MCHFVIHIPVVNLDRDLGPLRLTAWPNTHIHTNTHSTHFLSPHPRAYTIHHLPMNLPPSTSTLHFCASLSVTLLLPSISSLPSLRCQVGWVLSYAQTCRGFLILPIWCRCRPFLLSVLIFLRTKQCWQRGIISPKPAVFLTLICPPSCVPLYFLFPSLSLFSLSSPDSLPASGEYGLLQKSLMLLWRKIQSLWYTAPERQIDAQINSLFA